MEYSISASELKRSFFKSFFYTLFYRRASDIHVEFESTPKGDVRIVTTNGKSKRAYQPILFNDKELAIIDEMTRSVCSTNYSTEHS